MDPKVKALIELIPLVQGRRVKVQTLGGGLTNRNYCLISAGERFVLRIPGENSALLGIDRTVEYSCARAAFKLGIGPEVVAFFPEYGAMVTRFVPGRVLEPDTLRTPAVLQCVIGSLRRYHEGPSGAGHFSAFDTVRRYHGDAQKRNVMLPTKVALALDTLTRIEQAVGEPDHLCNCHNDLLPGNFVYNKSAIWILDWEYGGVGDMFFDLGNLAANGLFEHEMEIRLLEICFGKARSIDLRRLRLMRLVSDLREAMWGFLQMGISTLDFDYRAYARLHLGRFLKGAERTTLD